MRKTLFCLCLCLTLGLALAHVTATGAESAASAPAPAPTATPSPGVNPSDYPEIGDEELGQLRYALMIADQGPDDFRHLEGIDQLGMTSYRYALAFMTYFLALEQYYKLPACPELIQPRMERLIRKMTRKPVWEFWAGVSPGVPVLEPGMNKPYPEEHDPVAHRNIMYSGHLGHMIGLYEMLYHDYQWDQPAAIVFAWSAKEKYEYDHHSLIKVMYDQMANNPWHGIECEPNAVFPECNQHPILAFMLHDQQHGTKFAAASALFLDFFLQHKMIDPNSHQTAMLYLVKQDLTVANDSPRYRNAVDLVLAPAVSLGIVTLESSSANGWTGTFMHAWQPALIERHYPYQRARHLRESGESASLAKEYWEPNLNYGFFAMLAGEVGDSSTRDRLLRFADSRYLPEWSGGALSYPYNQNRKCTNLTGQLLAIVRANPKDGLLTLHNRPFGEVHFVAPRLEGLEFPRVALRRAIYDEGRRALVFTTEPGGARGGESKARIIQLDPATSYRLLRDGREVDAFQFLAEREVKVPLDGRHDFVLVAD